MYKNISLMILHSNDELMVVGLMEDNISSIYFRLNAVKALKVLNYFCVD